MNQQQLRVFETTFQKTNKILKAIEERFEWADRHAAYVVFRAVTHTLRDRLPIESAVAFASQLPLILKGVFYDGWKPSITPIKMKKEEFVGEVERILNPPFEQNTEEIIKGVLAVLESYTTPAEVRKIKKLLPKDIARMLS